MAIIDPSTETSLIMGMLTDYFAATEEEATACAERGPHGTALAHAELKWVEPSILLGRLWAHATGAEYDLDEFDGEGDIVAFREECDTYLAQIKDACTAVLAAIGEDRVPRLAIRWSYAEEWVGRPDPSELAGVIRELRAVARAATAAGRHLYVWICL